MSDSVIPLLTTISVVCSDEKRLYEALKNALTWKFNPADGNPLKTLQLISPKQAIVWIKGSYVVDALVSSGNFPISGPLSATFQQCGNALSSLVEVLAKSKNRFLIDSNKMDNIEDVLKRKFRGDVEFFRSNLRIVCHFASPSFAELGFRLIQQIVADHEKENPDCFSVRHIAFKDHKMIVCSYQGTLPFSNFCGELLLRRSSLTELIQAHINVLTEKPLILNVSSSQESTSSVEPIYIVCASYYDLRLLSNCPSISIHGGQIVFKDVCEHSSDVVVVDKSRPSHDVYIFWDLHACPLADGQVNRSHYSSSSELTQLYDNIKTILKYTFCKVSRRVNFSACGATLFVPFNVQDVSLALQWYVEELVRLGFKVVSVTSEVSVSMRSEVELLCGGEAVNSKPVLCFLTNHEPFEKLVSFLKLEHFDDIALIHNSQVNSNALNCLAVKQYSWSEVRRLHLLSPGQVDTLLGGTSVTPMIMHPPSDESIRSNASSDWIKRLMTGVKEPPTATVMNTEKCLRLSSHQDLTQMKVETVIDLKHMSLGCFFEKLIMWGREEQSKEEPMGKETDSFEEDPFFVGPLFGERSTAEGSANGRSATGEVRSCTAVRVDLNIKTKKYLLILRGTTSQGVEKRSRSLNLMIDDALRCRQTHEMKDWDLKHRAALKDSDCIQRQQDIAKACVLFHYSGTKVIAEIVALRPHQHTSMLKFLEKLKAREVLWDVPEYCISKYTDVEWEKLRIQFSIYVEILVEKPDRNTLSNRLTALTTAAANVYGKFQPKSGTIMNSLHIWGFGSLMEQALEFILREGFKDPVVPIVLPPPPPAASTVPTPWAGVEDDMSGPSTSSVSVKRISVIERKFFGSYSFQDREAGIFFYAFETEFYTFMQQKFSVGVDQIKSGVGQTKINAQSRDEAFRNAVLKVSFYGSTQANVAAARSYLDQLNPRNLKRVQVFFPQAHLAKYKEIQNKRSSQASYLAAIRRDGTATVGTVDPMTSRGYINIRIKPLMHSHGLRRMALPADTTVTICGSTLVSMDPEMKLFAEVEQQFQRIPAEYLTNTVQVPFSHPLKNQLTMKAHRESFMKEHGLVGLKWDEGSRSSGLTGTAKLWAKSDAEMNSALNAIYSAEIAMDETTSSYRNLEPDEPPQESSSLGSLGNDSTYSDPDSLSPSLSKSSLAVVDSTGKLASTSNAPTCSESLIYWPNLCTARVLSREPYRAKLNAMLDESSQCGLTVVCPYLDPRTQENIGISLSGDRSAVLDRTNPLKSFLDSVANKIASLTVVLSDQQYNCLVNSDKAVVDVIQDQAGALIVLDQDVADSERTECLIDLRLASPPNPLVDAGLLTVKVKNSCAMQAVDVAVISTKTSEEGWSWGANTLLTVIDRSHLPSLTKVESNQAMAGEVLVHSDPYTSKTILRLMPKYVHGAQNQSQELITAIRRGLSVADRYSLKAVAVAAPIDCGAFSELSQNMIRSLTVDAVLDFARTCQTILSISRIACIELNSSIAKERSPRGLSINEKDASLMIGANDPMALALIKHLEAQKRSMSSVSADLHNFLMADSSSGSSHMSARENPLTLVSANVPLPMTLLPDVNSPFRSLFTKTIVIKSDPEGILLSLELIKGLSVLSE